jgi:hypothetical protein
VKPTEKCFLCVPKKHKEKTQRKIISQRSIGVSGLSAYDFSPCIVILTPGRKK